MRTRSLNRVVGEVAGQAAEVDRLPHHPHAHQAPAGRGKRFLDGSGDISRQASERDQPEPFSKQAVAHEHRIDPAGELIGVPEFPLS